MSQDIKAELQHTVVRLCTEQLRDRTFSKTTVWMAVQTLCWAPLAEGLFMRNFQEQGGHCIPPSTENQRVYLNDALDIAEVLKKTIMGGLLPCCIFGTSQAKCECLILTGTHLPLNLSSREASWTCAELCFGGLCFLIFPWCKLCLSTRGNSVDFTQHHLLWAFLLPSVPTLHHFHLLSPWSWSVRGWP